MTRRQALTALVFITASVSVARADVESAIEELKTTLAGVLGDIAKSVTETQRKLEEVYPLSTTQPLRPSFAPVGSLVDEARATAALFDLAGSAEQLVQGVLGAGPRVDKKTWQAVFGAPVPSYRGDIDELVDLTAVLGINVVTSRVRESGPQHEFWTDLYGLTRGGQQDQSAGMAERHIALGMAGLGRVLVEQGETLTGDLALSTLRHQEAQSRRNLALGAALADYSAVAGASR